ncbi:MAG: hypothetical protein WA705_11585 [Candidatus Ozemobacteraceae bacterium]
MKSNEFKDALAKLVPAKELCGYTLHHEDTLVHHAKFKSSPEMLIANVPSHSSTLITALPSRMHAKDSKNIFSYRSRKRSAFRGFSLIEVVAATFIFMLSAIPVYYAISQGAAKEIDSTKLSMARKILESFRQEIMSRKFKEYEDMTPQQSTFIALQGGYPKTTSEIYDVQKKYKDFVFTPEFRFSGTGKSVIEFKGKIAWTTSDGKIHAPEEILFLLVKP